MLGQRSFMASRSTRRELGCPAEFERTLQLARQVNRAALAAGKHVLCQKPLMANAADAREIAELAATSGRVVMEVIQYRYHPLMLRAEQVIVLGELGKLERVDVAVCVFLARQRQRLRLLLCRWRGSPRRCCAGNRLKTTPEDTVENMSVIEAIYRAVGLSLRERA